jgi:hypothetical protein
MPEHFTEEQIMQAAEEKVNIHIIDNLFQRSFTNIIAIGYFIEGNSVRSLKDGSLIGFHFRKLFSVKSHMKLNV